MKRGRGAASTEETHCGSTHTSDMHSYKQKQIKREDFERHADYALLMEIIIHAESNLRKHLLPRCKCQVKICYHFIHYCNKIHVTTPKLLNSTRVLSSLMQHHMCGCVLQGRQTIFSWDVPRAVGLGTCDHRNEPQDSNVKIDESTDH